MNLCTMSCTYSTPQDDTANQCSAYVVALPTNDKRQGKGLSYPV